MACGMSHMACGMNKLKGITKSSRLFRDSSLINFLEQKRIHEMVKVFLGNLYNYNSCAQIANNDQIDDDSDNGIIVSVE